MALGKEMFAEFFQKIFAEGNGMALGKELFFFFEKSLTRASNHGPRQRNVAEFF